MSTSSVTTQTLSSNPLISSGSSSSSSSDSGLSTLNYNFNEFLTLFTTQLQNQDPTNPMDTTAMTNQLAMFSEVEQTASLGSKLDKLIALQPGSSLTSAVGYMGHTVTANGNQVSLSKGTATIGYNMPSGAESVNIQISNSAGNLVASLSGVATAGNQSVTWNGKDSSGGTVSDGVYTVAVTANTGTSAKVTPTPQTTGKVVGVENSSGNTLLDLGNGITVKTSDVLSIAS